MDVKIQVAIGHLRDAKTMDEIRAVFMRILTDIGVASFTYGGVRLPRSGSAEPLILTTYPTDWVHQYVTCGYQAMDPVVRTGLASFLPFSWAEVKATKRERVTLAEGTAAGLVSGLSVPVHGIAAEMALISFSSEMGVKEFERFLEFHAHGLHILAMHFHACVADLSAKDDSLLMVHLTNRETEVMTWVAHGKTTWEISEILRLSEATVVFHVENAKRKLGAASRSYAVAKALRLGLITI